MADYKKMYYTLFDSMEKAFYDFQKAMLECEEIYVQTDENDEDAEQKREQFKIIDFDSSK